MSDQKPPEENLGEEFRQLGKNLVDLLHSAWDSPERLKLQQDIREGINNLGENLRQEVDNFQQSPSGQRLKTEVDDINNRLKSGELEQKIRREIADALKSVNSELQRWLEQQPKKTEAQPPEPAEETGDKPPVNPA